MYTAKILRKAVDKQTKRLFIDVAYYLDGKAEPEATEQMVLWIETTLEEIKRKIAREIKRLEQYDINIASIVDGDIDLSTVTEATPTTEDIDKQKWFRNFNRLEQLTKLSTLGALRPALTTELDTLKTTVATDFKKAYIADM